MSSYHITELAMALIHQSSTAPYIHNTVSACVCVCVCLCANHSGTNHNRYT